MRKNFLHFFALLMLFVGIHSSQAQTTVWPTADAATIAASQFSDTTQIFKSTTATPNPPAGFKGWISKPVSCDDPAKLQNTHWDWARGGAGTKGLRWQTRTPIASASAANGAAIFNSDFLDNKGTGDFGNGISPSPHGADLISPIIDATGKDGLVVVFDEYFRASDVALTAVTWSEDGGTTWKDTISIPENTLTTLYETKDQIAVRLKYNDPRSSTGALIGTGAPSKGTANFRIKFMFSGDYYFWILDDVKLVSMDNNLRVNYNWFASPQNVYMPRAQADTVVFMADISNQGNKAATNVKLTVNIKEAASGTSVYTATKNYGTVKADSTAENEVFGKWMPPTTGSATISYIGTYIVSSDNPDNYTLNDTIFFPFAMADSLFRNDLSNGFIIPTRPDGWAAGTPHNWKVGNYFYFPKGAKSTVTRINVALDTTTLVGVPLLASLYEWTDANANGVVELTERIQVAAAEVIVPKVANPASVNFYLENLAGAGPVKLKDGTAYLAMIELITTKKDINMQVYWNTEVANAPMQFATAKIGRPRYSSIISYDGTDARPWNTNTFLGDELENLTPLVNLRTWPIKTDNKELLSENNKINLFPNPTSNELKVAFDLEKTEQTLLVRIIDMSGKILKERDYDNIKKETISVDVHDIPNGVYNIQVQTIGNYRTMRFVKAD
jgi:Secretion system C-terminal sorting domain